MKKIGLYSALCLFINGTLSAESLFDTPLDTISLDNIACLPSTPKDTRQITSDFLCEIVQDLINSTPEDARILVLTLLETKIDLFKENIYCQTRELNNRSLFKMPLLRKHLPTTDWWELTVHTFYDQMHSPISSYFILDSQTLQDNLEEILPLFTTSTLDEFLELANEVEVTQRRAGFMFNFIKRYRDWFFGIRVPFYYLERNYDAPGEPEIPTSFIRAHLVNDKVGLGDSEFSFAYYWHDTECATVVGGLELTLPTAITIHNGLYGSPYPNCGYRPSFDFFNTIIDNFFANNGDLCTTINQFNDLGTQVVDQLGALFLDKKLGANHHPAIAIFIQPTIQLSDHWLFEGYTSIEYFIPKTEKRFFITPRNIAEFDNFDFTNDDAAKQNLSFLSQQLFDALFFNNFQVRVFPGFVFELTGQFTLDYEAWQVHAGADFWLQTSEHFEDICVPKGQQITSTSISRALRKQAEQVRVFGGFQYTLERNHTWIFGFHGDASVWNRNIGKGFSLVFSLTSYF